MSTEWVLSDDAAILQFVNHETYHKLVQRPDGTWCACFVDPDYGELRGAGSTRADACRTALEMIHERREDKLRVEVEALASQMAEQLRLEGQYGVYYHWGQSGFSSRIDVIAEVVPDDLRKLARFVLTRQEPTQKEQ